MLNGVPLDRGNICFSNFINIVIHLTGVATVKYLWLENTMVLTGEDMDAMSIERTMREKSGPFYYCK